MCQDIDNCIKLFKNQKPENTIVVKPEQIRTQDKPDTKSRNKHLIGIFFKVQTLTEATSDSH